MTDKRSKSDRLAQVRSSLERQRGYLALVHAVTELSNESTDLDAVLSETLQMVCESFEWPIGFAARVDEGADGRSLTGDRYWHVEDPELEAELETLDLAPLVDWTLITGEAQTYVGEVAAEHLAVVEPLGLRALFTSPIRSGQATVALLAFFARGYDADKLPAFELVLETVSRTLGRVIEREAVEAQRGALQRAEIGRDAAEAHADALTELTDKLERAVQSRDSVLSILSHDLRGPLNNIILAMSLVETGDETQRQMAAASVRRAVDRAQRLIRSLTEVGELSNGGLEVHPRPVNPGALIRAALEDIQPAVNQRSVELVVDVEADLAPVLADRDRVIQILDNLLRNALKFGPPGGELFVGAAAVEGAVEFSVRDQGPGLDLETQARVFERFWQAPSTRRTQAGGSGLGLAIAKGLVERHGGTIGVESAPGEGARFYFTIPTG